MFVYGAPVALVAGRVYTSIARNDDVGTKTPVSRAAGGAGAVISLDLCAVRGSDSALVEWVVALARFFDLVPVEISAGLNDCLVGADEWRKQVLNLVVQFSLVLRSGCRLDRRYRRRCQRPGRQQQANGLCRQLRKCRLG